ncbi:acyl-CoA synthetase [Marinobacterium maritimum]|uniref:Acyl-CoA synthetase n=2 Tax=Marinobacterium maritimum TaxID=500162 RepID=A0ABN1I3J2_9GAMM
MLLPNLPQNHFTLWGGEAAGIINPINPMLEPDHIAGILNAANTKLLVALAPFPGTDTWDKVEQIKPLVPSLEKVLYVDMCQFLPSEQVTAIRTELPLPTEDWAINFDRWIATQPDGQLTTKRTISPQDVASLFHTGGTTGVPKLAPHSHYNEVIDSLMVKVHLGFRDTDTLLTGLPTFHVNGALVTGLASFLSGAHVVLASAQGFRSPDIITNFWKLVEKHKITFFSGVPAIFAGLLQVPVGDADISSIKAALSGGAALPREVHRQFEALTGCALIEGYGLTESTAASIANPPAGERRTGSIGICMPYTEGKVVLLDEQGQYLRDCLTNESGSLVLRGPNIFKGYTDPTKNTDIWVDGDWFNTGDLARQDEDGYFWITGRSKDLIIRGGHNIDPGMIEEALNLHPEVVMAAAVGKPCPRVGELPVAYVTLTAGSEVSEDELLAFCQQEISERAAIPKEICIVEEIPLTAVGKVFKPSLRLMSMRYVLQQELEELLGQTGFEVEVEACSKHGQKATIQLLDEGAVAKRAQLEDKLGNYAIHYEFI